MAITPNRSTAEFLMWISGEEFPGINEDRLFAISQGYLDASGALTAELAPVVVTAVNAIRANFKGAGEQAFADSMAKFVSQEPRYLYVAAEELKKAGDAARKTAQQVQYVKLIIILTIVEVMIEFVIAIAMAFINPAFMAWFAARSAVVKFFVQNSIGRLISAVVSNMVLGIGFQTAMDFLAQRIQIDILHTRTNEEWDWDATRQSVEVGALGGALNVIGAGIGGLIVKAASSRFRAGANGLHNLDGDRDPLWPPRDRPDTPDHTPDYTPDPPEFSGRPQTPFVELMGNLGWSERSAKRLADVFEVANEAGIEYLTEGLYSFMKEGVWDASGFAITSGLFSGIAEQAGHKVGKLSGTSLHDFQEQVRQTLHLDPETGQFLGFKRSEGYDQLSDTLYDDEAPSRVDEFKLDTTTVTSVAAAGLDNATTTSVPGQPQTPIAGQTSGPDNGRSPVTSPVTGPVASPVTGPVASPGSGSGSGAGSGSPDGQVPVDSSPRSLIEWESFDSPASDTPWKTPEDLETSGLPVPGVGAFDAALADAGVTPPGASGTPELSPTSTSDSFSADGSTLDGGSAAFDSATDPFAGWERAESLVPGTVAVPDLAIAFGRGYQRARFATTVLVPTKKPGETQSEENIRWAAEYLATQALPVIAETIFLHVHEQNGGFLVGEKVHTPAQFAGWLADKGILGDSKRVVLVSCRAGAVPAPATVAGTASAQPSPSEPSEPSDTALDGGGSVRHTPDSPAEQLARHLSGVKVLASDKDVYASPAGTLYSFTAGYNQDSQPVVSGGQTGWWKEFEDTTLTPPGNPQAPSLVRETSLSSTDPLSKVLSNNRPTELVLQTAIRWGRSPEVESLFTNLSKIPEGTDGRDALEARLRILELVDTGQIDTKLFEDSKDDEVGEIGAGIQALLGTTQATPQDSRARPHIDRAKDDPDLIEVIQDRRNGAEPAPAEPPLPAKPVPWFFKELGLLGDGYVSSVIGTHDEALIAQAKEGLKAAMDRGSARLMDWARKSDGDSAAEWLDGVLRSNNTDDWQELLQVGKTWHHKGAPFVRVYARVHGDTEYGGDPALANQNAGNANVTDNYKSKYGDTTVVESKDGAWGRSWSAGPSWLSSLTNKYLSHMLTLVKVTGGSRRTWSAADAREVQSGNRNLVANSFDHKANLKLFIEVNGAEAYSMTLGQHVLISLPQAFSQPGDTSFDPVSAPSPAVANPDAVQAVDFAINAVSFENLVLDLQQKMRVQLKLDEATAAQLAHDIRKEVTNEKTVKDRSQWWTAGPTPSPFLHLPLGFLHNLDGHLVLKGTLASLKEVTTTASGVQIRNDIAGTSTAKSSSGAETSVSFAAGVELPVHVGHMIVAPAVKYESSRARDESSAVARQAQAKTTVVTKDTQVRYRAVFTVEGVLRTNNGEISSKVDVVAEFSIPSNRKTKFEELAAKGPAAEGPVVKPRVRFGVDVATRRWQTRRGRAWRTGQAVKTVEAFTSQLGKGPVRVQLTSRVPDEVIAILVQEKKVTVLEPDGRIRPGQELTPAPVRAASQDPAAAADAISVWRSGDRQKYFVSPDGRVTRGKPSMLRRRRPARPRLLFPKHGIRHPRDLARIARWGVVELAVLGAETAIPVNWQFRNVVPESPSQKAKVRYVLDPGEDRIVGAYMLSAGVVRFEPNPFGMVQQRMDTDKLAQLSEQIAKDRAEKFLAGRDNRRFQVQLGKDTLQAVEDMLRADPRVELLDGRGKVIPTDLAPANPGAPAARYVVSGEGIFTGALDVLTKSVVEPPHLAGGAGLGRGVVKEMPGAERVQEEVTRLVEEQLKQHKITLSPAERQNLDRKISVIFGVPGLRGNQRSLFDGRIHYETTIGKVTIVIDVKGVLGVLSNVYPQGGTDLDVQSKGMASYDKHRSRRLTRGFLLDTVLKGTLGGALLRWQIFGLRYHRPRELSLTTALGFKEYHRRKIVGSAPGAVENVQVFEKLASYHVGVTATRARTMRDGLRLATKSEILGHSTHVVSGDDVTVPVKFAVDDLPTDETTLDADTTTAWVNTPTADESRELALWLELKPRDDGVNAADPAQGEADTPDNSASPTGAASPAPAVPDPGGSGMTTNPADAGTSSSAPTAPTAPTAPSGPIVPTVPTVPTAPTEAGDPAPVTLAQAETGPARVTGFDQGVSGIAVKFHAVAQLNKEIAKKIQESTPPTWIYDPGNLTKKTNTPQTAPVTNTPQAEPETGSNLAEPGTNTNQAEPEAGTPQAGPETDTNLAGRETDTLLAEPEVYVTPELLESHAGEVLSPQGYLISLPRTPDGFERTLRVKAMAMTPKLGKSSPTAGLEHYVEADHRVVQGKRQGHGGEVTTGGSVLPLIDHDPSGQAHGGLTTTTANYAGFSGELGVVGQIGNSRSAMSGGLGVNLATYSGGGVNHTMTLVYQYEYSVHRPNANLVRDSVTVRDGLTTATPLVRAADLSLPMSPKDRALAENLADPLPGTPRQPIDEEAVWGYSHQERFHAFDVLPKVRRQLKDRGIDVDDAQIAQALETFYSNSALRAEIASLRTPHGSVLLLTIPQAFGVSKRIAVQVTAKTTDLAHRRHRSDVKITTGGQAFTQLIKGKSREGGWLAKFELDFATKVFEIGRFGLGMSATREAKTEHEDEAISTKRDIRRIAAKQSESEEYTANLEFEIRLYEGHEYAELFTSLGKVLAGPLTVISSVTDGRVAAAFQKWFTARHGTQEVLPPAVARAQGTTRLLTPTYLTRPGLPTARAANQVQTSFRPRAGLDLGREFGEQIVDGETLETSRLDFSEKMAGVVQAITIVDHQSFVDNLPVAALPGGHREPSPKPEAKRYSPVSDAKYAMDTALNQSNIRANIGLLLKRAYQVPGADGDTFNTAMVLGKGEWLGFGINEQLNFGEQSAEHESKYKKAVAWHFQPPSVVVGASLEALHSHDRPMFSAGGPGIVISQGTGLANSAGDYVEHNKMIKGPFVVYRFPATLLGEALRAAKPGQPSTFDSMANGTGRGTVVQTELESGVVLMLPLDDFHAIAAQHSDLLPAPLGVPDLARRFATDPGLVDGVFRVIDQYRRANPAHEGPVLEEHLRPMFDRWVKQDGTTTTTALTADDVVSLAAATDPALAEKYGPLNEPSTDAVPAGWTFGAWQEAKENSLPPDPRPGQLWQFRIDPLGRPKLRTVSFQPAPPGKALTPGELAAATKALPLTELSRVHGVIEWKTDTATADGRYELSIPDDVVRDLRWESNAKDWLGLKAEVLPPVRLSRKRLVVVPSYLPGETAEQTHKRHDTELHLAKRQLNLPEGTLGIQVHTVNGKFRVGTQQYNATQFAEYLHHHGILREDRLLRGAEPLRVVLIACEAATTSNESGSPMAARFFGATRERGVTGVVAPNGIAALAPSLGGQVAVAYGFDQDGKPILAQGAEHSSWKEIRVRAGGPLRTRTDPQGVARTYTAVYYSNPLPADDPLNAFLITAPAETKLEGAVQWGQSSAPPGNDTFADESLSDDGLNDDGFHGDGFNGDADLWLYDDTDSVVVHQSDTSGPEETSSVGQPDTAPVIPVQAMPSADLNALFEQASNVRQHENPAGWIAAQLQQQPGSGPILLELNKPKAVESNYRETVLTVHRRMQADNRLTIGIQNEINSWEAELHDLDLSVREMKERFERIQRYLKLEHRTPPPRVLSRQGNLVDDPEGLGRSIAQSLNRPVELHVAEDGWHVKKSFDANGDMTETVELGQILPDATQTADFHAEDLLGPDLFGARQAPPPPPWLRGIDRSKVPTKKLLAFFKTLDMASQAPMPYGPIDVDGLPEDEESVLTVPRRPGRDARTWSSGATVPVGIKDIPDVFEVPKLFWSIWVGSPLSPDRPSKVAFRQNLADRRAKDLNVILWTDVTRQEIEEARRVKPDTGRLGQVWEMVDWAEHHGVMLINLDEVYHSEAPMLLDSEIRMEMSKNMPLGWAAASDGDRSQIVFDFGGFYADGDDVLAYGTKAEIYAALEDELAHDGFQIQHQDVDAGNDVLAAARHHPLVDAIRTKQKASYQLPQRLVALHFEGLPRLEAEALSFPEDETPLLTVPFLRNSVIFRAGPSLFSNPQWAGFDAIDQLPKQTVYTPESDQSWVPHGLDPIRAYTAQEAPRMLKVAAAILVRELYNREGDLHLTYVAPIVNGFPPRYREALWKALADFFTEEPRLAIRLETVTDRLLEVEEGSPSTVISLELPQAVRDRLGLTDPPPGEDPPGLWRAGELARPVTPHWLHPEAVGSEPDLYHLVGLAHEHGRRGEKAVEWVVSQIRHKLTVAPVPRLTVRIALADHQTVLYRAAVEHVHQMASLSDGMSHHVKTSVTKWKAELSTEELTVEQMRARVEWMRQRTNDPELYGLLGLFTPDALTERLVRELNRPVDSHVTGLDSNVTVSRRDPSGRSWPVGEDGRARNDIRGEANLYTMLEAAARNGEVNTEASVVAQLAGHVRSLPDPSNFTIVANQVEGFYRDALPVIREHVKTLTPSPVNTELRAIAGQAEQWHRELFWKALSTADMHDRLNLVRGAANIAGDADLLAKLGSIETALLSSHPFGVAEKVATAAGQDIRISVTGLNGLTVPWIVRPGGGRSIERLSDEEKENLESIRFLQIVATEWPVVLSAAVRILANLPENTSRDFRLYQVTPLIEELRDPASGWRTVADYLSAEPSTAAKLKPVIDQIRALVVPNTLPAQADPESAVSRGPAPLDPAKADPAWSEVDGPEAEFLRQYNEIMAPLHKLTLSNDQIRQRLVEMSEHAGDGKIVFYAEALSSEVREALRDIDDAMPQAPDPTVTSFVHDVLLAITAVPTRTKQVPVRNSFLPAYRHDVREIMTLSPRQAAQVLTDLASELSAGKEIATLTSIGYGVGQSLGERLARLTLLNLTVPGRRELIGDALFIALLGNPLLGEARYAISGGEEQFFLNTCFPAAINQYARSRVPNMLGLLLLGKAVIDSVAAPLQTPQFFPILGKLDRLVSRRTIGELISKRVQQARDEFISIREQVETLVNGATDPRTARDSLEDLTVRWSRIMQKVALLLLPPGTSSTQQVSVLTRKLVPDQWHLSQYLSMHAVVDRLARRLVGMDDPHDYQLAMSHVDDWPHSATEPLSDWLIQPGSPSQRADALWAEVRLAGGIVVGTQDHALYLRAVTQAGQRLFAIGDPMRANLELVNPAEMTQRAVRQQWEIAASHLQNASTADSWHRAESAVAVRGARRPAENAQNSRIRWAAEAGSANKVSELLSAKDPGTIVVQVHTKDGEFESGNEVLSATAFADQLVTKVGLAGKSRVVLASGKAGRASNSADGKPVPSLAAQVVMALHQRGAGVTVLAADTDVYTAPDGRLFAFNAGLGADSRPVLTSGTWKQFSVAQMTTSEPGPSASHAHQVVETVVERSSLPGNDPVAQVLIGALPPEGMSLTEMVQWGDTSQRNGTAIVTP